jgi:hypothetical protein
MTENNNKMIKEYVYNIERQSTEFGVRKLSVFSLSGFSVSDFLFMIGGGK